MFLEGFPFFSLYQFLLPRIQPLINWHFLFNSLHNTTHFCALLINPPATGAFHTCTDAALDNYDSLPSACLTSDLFTHKLASFMWVFFRVTTNF